MTRYCCIDLGKDVTGIVVADVEGKNEITLRHMETCEGKHTIRHVIDDVIPRWKNTQLTVVYENMYIGRGTRNYDGIRMQKALKKACANVADVTSKALLPSQKASMIPGKKHKDRKKRSEEVATAFLQEHHPEWIEAYNALEPRKHDVSDALLMVMYLAAH